jgi:beta-glucanase (GH16 family)
MRQFVLTVTAVFTTLCIVASAPPTIAQAQTSAAPAGPPTWSDEFDGTSLDASRWSHRATGVRADGILTPQAVSVGGGALTIRTYTDAGKHYSGMVSTQSQGGAGFQQAYGFFEARVRFAGAPGQWSAFWLQSPTIGSPLGDPGTAGVEMDIVEHRARCVTAPAPAPPSLCAPGSDVSDRAQQGLIWDGYGEHRASMVRLSDPLPGLGAGGWHTWALRWTPTQLTFYYDGAETWSRSGPTSRASEYVVLSSEVGEAFAGPIPSSGYGSREATTTGMQVDYVRVWAPTTAPAAPAIAPPAAADRTAPKARLLGRTSPRIGAPKVIRIACLEEACRSTVTAAVRVARLRRAPQTTYRSGRRTARIAPGATATVQLRLSRAVRGAVRRALRHRRRVLLKVVVRVADGAGNARVLTRHVALKL